MADKINKSDLFGDLDLNAEIKALKDLLGVVNQLQEETKKMAKNKLEEVVGIDAATLAGIKKLIKLQEDADKIKNQSNELVTEEIKLKERLVKAQSEQGKETAKLRLEIQEQNKANKEAAKTELGLLSTYQEESKRLNEMRKRVKNLLLEKKKLTKADKALIKETQELDAKLKNVDKTVGQTQRSVGDYAIATQRAGDALKSMAKKALAATGIALSLKGVLDGVVSSLKDNEEGSEKLRSGMAQLNAVMSVLKNTGAGFLTDIFSSIVKMKDAGASGTEIFLELGDIILAASDNFDGFNEKVSKAAKAAKEAEDAQIALEKSSRQQRLEIAKLSAEIEKQNEIAGDSSRTFVEISEALDKSGIAEVKRAKLIRDIAQKELKIIQDKIDARGENANNLELENEKLEKQIELTDANSDLTVAQTKLQKERAINARDLFEQELDFAIDAFDNQKTINERIINDDRVGVKQKKKIFERTVELAESSFSEQNALFDKQLELKQKRLELEIQSDEQKVKTLTGSSKKLLQAEIDANKITLQGMKDKLDLNALVLLDDEKLIRERIKGYGFDEAETKRLLEVIRERKTVLQDNEDTEKFINEQAKKRNQETIESVKETFDAINEIYAESQQARKDTLEQELEDSKSQEESLLRLAEQRVLFANESLAVEKAKQAEIQKELAKTEKRKQLLAATQTALELMGSYAEGGSKTPFQDAFGDITKMLGALKTIQFFADGTESVEGGVQGKDSVPAMLMPKERVIDVSNNMKIGGMSNDQLSELAFKYRTGRLDQDLPSIKVEKQRFESNKELISRVKDVEKAIRNIPEVSIDPHALANFITETIRRQNKVDRNHYKTNEIFK